MILRLSTLFLFSRIGVLRERELSLEGWLERGESGGLRGVELVDAIHLDDDFEVVHGQFILRIGVVS
jgi:hypothetical protein